MNRDLHGNTHIKKNILFLFPYAVFHNFLHFLKGETAYTLKN